MEEKELLVNMESNDWTDERLEKAENEEIALKVEKAKADPRRIYLDSPQMQEKFRKIDEILKEKEMDRELVEVMKKRLDDPQTGNTETDEFFESLGLEKDVH